MRRFADELRAQGIAATKVNFHAGDAVFFRGPDALSYRGRFDEWPAFVERLIVERGIDGVFAFGDCRPLHRMAFEVSRGLGVKVFAFEEGYLRPDWITLEQGGVNGNSEMPRDPSFYESLSLPDLPEATPIGASFHYNSWYSTLSALAFTHLNGGYPHYQHHRPLNAWYHTFVWCRNVLRKRRFAWQERHMMSELTGPLSGRYFFVPLQVHCDFQILHSPYDNVLQFVEEVVATFAEHGRASDHILFKHHPMDRAYREYGDLFRKHARQYGLEGRLHYCHDLHLPTLLKNAKGTITINSTVGLSSMFHGTPVVCLGTAVYDMPGLTHRGDLSSFLDAPGTVDAQLYESFRRYLLHVNQVNGSFYKRLPGVPTPTGARWFPGLPAELADGSNSR
ncbi:MAG: capsular biosynthesis protein [Myxococcota bacterium]|nr:capsular biosynthesis protein [Myxococcota bacterium]